MTIENKYLDGRIIHSEGTTIIKNKYGKEIYYRNEYSNFECYSTYDIHNNLIRTVTNDTVTEIGRASCRERGLRLV